MTSREVVRRTVRFQTPPRLAVNFPEEYGNDFYFKWMDPSPDGVYSKGTDEWGSKWDNVGNSLIGQVVDYPIKEWSDLDRIKIPDVTTDNRWGYFRNARAKVGEKFIGCYGISLFERLKFLRGIENGWTDPYLYPDELERLLDILTDMNIKAIGKCKEFDMDGYFISDDWGLQSSLILPPELFRKYWKPRYEKIFRAIREAGMISIMHSCGYILDIIEDLIEVGLDVINLDQQENMGLEVLGSRFGGRITFFAPVDIQKTMVYGSLDDIRKYCRQMVKHLWRPEGGFIPKWYPDPVGAGHSMDAVKAMCEEFLKISDEIYGGK